MVIKRRADLDGCYADPELLPLGDLLDGPGRANLPAKHARRLAIANARDENRSPQPFDPRFEERRMERAASYVEVLLRVTTAKG